MVPRELHERVISRRNDLLPMSSAMLKTPDEDCPTSK